MRRRAAGGGGGGGGALTTRLTHSPCLAPSLTSLPPSLLPLFPATSVFLLDLLKACEPRAVNPSIPTAGETEEDRAKNAKYVISVARKIGAKIYCSWQDIRDIKPKMIMTLCVDGCARAAARQGRVTRRRCRFILSLPVLTLPPPPSPSLSPSPFFRVASIMSETLARSAAK